MEKPGITIALGVITIGASKSSKRVGDMMAGTFVVNERAGKATALRATDWWVPPEYFNAPGYIDLVFLP